MAARGTEVVEVLRPGKPSRTGDPTAPTSLGSLVGCIVWPRSTDETAERGTITIEGYNVWAPNPVKVTPKATDIVKVRGEDWQIDGVPGDWRNKQGQKLGILFAVTKYGA
jgi:hypothetical protein